MPLSPYLDSFPSVGESCYLHPSAQLIGNVRLGRDSSVWCNAVLRGDVNRIEIGACSNIQDFSMGHGAILHGCRIGDECLIGMGSMVMDDAVIQPRVMLGAGSLVSPGKTLESGYLYVGRPAVRVRPLTPDEIAYLRYSAEHYVRVKNNYLSSPQTT